MFNENVDNSSFRDAMANYISHPAKNELAFFKKLLEARFLSPVILKPGKGTPDCDFDLVNISDEDNQKFLPVFTDRRELLLFSPGNKLDTVTLRFGDYRHIFLVPGSTHSGLVINPGSDSFIIDHHHMLQIDELLPVLGLTIAGPFDIPISLAPEHTED